MVRVMGRRMKITRGAVSIAVTDLGGRSLFAGYASNNLPRSMAVRVDAIAPLCLAWTVQHVTPGEE